MATLGVRNNNPFNLRSNHVEWLGKVGSNKGFCVFKDLESGVRAGLINLLTQMRRSKTLKELISRYAPPTENDTDSYFKYVNKSTQKFGFDLEKYYLHGLHSIIIFHYIAKSIVYYESKYNLSLSYLTHILNRYHIFDKHLALLKKKYLLNTKK